MNVPPQKLKKSLKGTSQYYQYLSHVCLCLRSSSKYRPQSSEPQTDGLSVSTTADGSQPNVRKLCDTPPPATQAHTHNLAYYDNIICQVCPNCPRVYSHLSSFFTLDPSFCLLSSSSSSCSLLCSPLACLSSGLFFVCPCSSYCPIIQLRHFWISLCTVPVSLMLFTLANPLRGPHQPAIPGNISPETCITTSR